MINGILLIIISIILIAVFLLKGQTTVTGQNGSITTVKSLVCETDNPEYQFLSYDNSDKKNAKVSVLFNANGINSISLLFTLHYSDSKAVDSSRAINSANLYIFYGEDGLPANSFSKSLSSDNEKVTISLYASRDDFNSMTSKYFMADGLEENSDIEDFERSYTKQWFVCIKNNNLTKEENEK